jgi:hypothetical protein
MAGLRGNQAYLAWSKQTAKGTPNTTYARRSPFSGGNIQPARTVESLSETDANRDIGVSYVSSVGVEGAPEIYVRDNSIDSILEAALGANVDSGTTNFTHTITPANTIPYLTLFRGIGGTLFEQFNDNFISELTISAEAGQPLTASADIVGRTALRLAAEPGSLPALESGAAYTFNDAAVTLGGGATALVSSFELTIANNVSSQQTDDFVPYDVVVGQREVTLGYTLVFEDLLQYNLFHYGSTSGTAHSGALATTSAAFTFTKGVNNEISFTLPSIAYQEFGVEPDPGGDPITVDVRAQAQRGVSPVVTAVVKNQKATPWTP